MTGLTRILGAIAFTALCLPAQPWKLPPLRDQAAVQQKWLEARLTHVLPALMRKHNVAMWLVICREYNEDPVFFSLVSPTTLAARRRTIYVFHDRGPQGVERLALGGSSQNGLYTVYRDPSSQGREIMGDSQWATLRKLIDDRKPANIAINISPTHAFSDGLSAGEFRQLEAALGPEWMKRVKPAELLPLEYIETRLPDMLSTYRGMQSVVHWIIGRAFSSEVITPGKTTSQDVVWWLRQQTRDLGYDTWFHTTVRVQKPSAAKVDLLDEGAATIIERGDVLHVDYGLTAFGLNTDTQHMGYVLREGETEPPAGVLRAFRQAQRLQEIVLQRLRPNATGNSVLATSLEQMRKEDINGSVYSHPIGDHGHGAGPIIGLWDRQQGVPGRGDPPLIPHSWFSIELSVRAPVPEWEGRELWIGLVEDAVIDAAGQSAWALQRQERFHLVR